MTPQEAHCIERLLGAITRRVTESADLLGVAHAANNKGRTEVVRERLEVSRDNMRWIELMITDYLGGK
jgi:hypothetical protein